MKLRNSRGESVAGLWCAYSVIPLFAPHSRYTRQAEEAGTEVDTVDMQIMLGNPASSSQGVP